eukprot:5845373-Pleurochrysis_carterae.AAC.1
MVYTQPVSSNSRHLQVKPIQSVGVTRHGPKDLPATPFVSIIVGKRGSGKTTAATALIRAYGCFQKIYIVSPTCRSKINEPLLRSMGVEEQNCYDDPSPESLQLILNAVEEEVEILKEYKRKMTLWNAFMKNTKNLNFWELDEICDEYGEITKPVHAYDGRYPSSLILCDDVVGSTIIRSKLLMNTTILHRHLADGNGVSMMFLTQSFISDTSGLPKIIRLQCTILLLFRTYSEKELLSVSHECRGETTHERFLVAYNTAMQGEGDHNFLLVDFMYKKNPNTKSMFRRNLDQFIIL